MMEQTFANAWDMDPVASIPKIVFTDLVEAVISGHRFKSKTYERMSDCIKFLFSKTCNIFLCFYAALDKSYLVVFSIKLFLSYLACYNFL
jgi:hypothetical protein